MKLFEEDLFSQSTPLFSEVDSAQRESISECLSSAFPNIGNVSSVMKSGGIEVNSQNFKVRTSNGLFLVKLASLKNAQLPAIERQQELIDWLTIRGNPVPCPVRNRDGVFLSEFRPGRFCLVMEFVEGDFFEGRETSLRSVGNGIGRLHRELAVVPEGLSSGRKYPGIPKEDLDCVHRTLSGEWSRLPADERALLESERGWLSELWEQVFPCSEPDALGCEGLLHIDLHPHNLLMDGDQLQSVLDFDSVMTAPYAVMAGFSACKLLRQAAVREGVSEVSRFNETYLEALNEGDGKLGISAEAALKGARFEIFRRIALILRLNLVEGNRQWNHVLKIQVRLLKEAAIILAA